MKRILHIALGYVAAVLLTAAGLTIYLLPGKVAEIFVVFTVLVGALSLVPFIVFVGIAEFKRIVDPPYYILTGGLTGAIAVFIFAGSFEKPDIYAIGIAGGLFAGVVYWLIAGRYAGMSREGGAAQ